MYFMLIICYERFIEINVLRTTYIKTKRFF